MLRLFEKLLFSATREELAANLRHASGQLGFESFHFSSHPPDNTQSAAKDRPFEGTDRKSPSVISDFPETWFAHYQAQDYQDIDPVLQHCANSILPAVWHLLPMPQDAQVARFFDEARRHGLASGVTYSILDKNSAYSIFSLTKETDRAADRRHIESQIGAGYLLMTYAHEAMKRLNAAGIANPVQLTVRETDCLSWVGRGKTSWEISRILTISERTVIFHVNNAVKKLDTRTRSQAVVKAASLGLIRP
jgi:DNA-binding CsgD family transcriptional regulator